MIKSVKTHIHIYVENILDSQSLMFNFLLFGATLIGSTPPREPTSSRSRYDSCTQLFYCNQPTGTKQTLLA